jgi:hypothetical protein
LGSKKPFRTHETIPRNTNFDVFLAQKMAQIERKFERKLKRIDPDQRSNHKYYFDQIIAH